MSSCVVLIMALVVALGPQVGVVDGEPKVPCFFIFGDSLSDSGNNNALQTLAKANFLPYGIDFLGGDHPTGRFTNGKTTVDLIGDELGLEGYIPPFAAAGEGEEILKGVNYASGSAGILPQTGYQVGARINMDMQLLNHKNIVSRIENLLGILNSTEYLNKCLYSVYAGSNDWMVNYFYPATGTSSRYTTQQFTNTLISQLSKQLTQLHDLGARKVVVFGLGPLGCLPSLNRFGTCTQGINDVLQGFNDGLKTMVDELNNRYPASKFITVNTINIVGSGLQNLGLRVTNVPCCGGTTRLCIPLSLPCEDRNDYAYWDGAHPTEAANKVLATRACNTKDPNDTYPFDVNHLVTPAL